MGFNWALAQVKAVMDQRAAERSYGLDGEQLTPSLAWNLPALRRECFKEVYDTGLDALGNWAGTLRNCRLAKAISDCGFGEIRCELVYKSAWKRQPGTAPGGQDLDRPPQGGTVDHELTHAY